VWNSSTTVISGALIGIPQNLVIHNQNKLAPLPAVLRVQPSYTTHLLKTHAKISFILESTNAARRRLSFAVTKTLPLFVKHVKPITVARSRLTNQFGTNSVSLPRHSPR